MATQPFTWYDPTKVAQGRADAAAGIDTGAFGTWRDRGWGGGGPQDFDNVGAVMNPLEGIAQQAGVAQTYKVGGTPEMVTTGNGDSQNQQLTGNMTGQTEAQVWIPPTYRHAETGAILVDAFTKDPAFYQGRAQLGATETVERGDGGRAEAPTGPQGYYASEADYTAARNAWYEKQGLPPTATILATEAEVENPTGNGSKDMTTLMYAYNPETGGATPIGGTNRYSPSDWVGGGRDFAKMIGIAAAAIFASPYVAEYFGTAAAEGVAAEGAAGTVAQTSATKAALYGAEGYGAGVGAAEAAGAAGAAGAGGAAYAPATNAALAESAVGTAGYGASSAGAGGAAGATGASAGGSLFDTIVNGAKGALPTTAAGWAQLAKQGYGMWTGAQLDEANAEDRSRARGVGDFAMSQAGEQAGLLRDKIQPMLDARDTAQWDTSRGLVDSNLEDAGLARQRATQAWDQGAKDYAFQDMFGDMARKAQDGSYGNELAGIANADVAQSFDAAEGARQRSAQRLGVNPGSGAYLASMADSYNSRALAQAGAMTGARRFARDKAVSMVAQAAGGWGTQATAGQQAGLSTGSRTAADVANIRGVNSTATLQGASNDAHNAINNSLGQASSAFNKTPAPSAYTFSGAAGLADSASRDWTLPEPKKP